MNTNEIFGEPISTYSSTQATDDGILVETSALLPEHNGYKPHIVSHITNNLLVTEEYFVENKELDIYGEPMADYKRVNIIDLLNQVGPRISTALKTNPDEYLVSGMTLEGPNGKKFKAWAGLNEHGRWTLMLPEDY